MPKPNEADPVATAQPGHVFWDDTDTDGYRALVMRGPLSLVAYVSGGASAPAFTPGMKRHRNLDGGSGA